MAIKLSDYSNSALLTKGQVRFNQGSESFQVGVYQNQRQRFTVTAVDDETASMSITDVAGNIYSYSYTGTGAETAAEIRDALLALIQADDSLSAIAYAEANSTANIDIIVKRKGASVSISGLAGAGSLTTVTEPVSGSAIPAGRIVVRNDTDLQVMQLPDSGSVTADFLGVVIRKHAYSVTDNNEDVSVPVGAHGEVMYRGEICIEVDSAVSAGGLVYVRINNGTLGIARADVDGGDAVLLSNAKFLNNGSAGDIVAIRLNN